MSISTVHKPTFLGVGAMKAATTWVAECLRCHPEVFVSSLKEPHYFSFNWDRGEEWYLDHFKNVQQEKAIGELSVTYICKPEYCRRIYESLGRIKIIINVRNPVERFISHYKHIYRVRKDGSAPAKWTVGSLPLGKIEMSTFEEVTKQHPVLLTRGKYHEMIVRYMNTFGTENVFVIFKDDIDHEPEKVVRELYGFLGVDKNFVPPVLNRVVGDSVTPKSMRLAKVVSHTHYLLKEKFPAGIAWARKLHISQFYKSINLKQVRETTLEQNVLLALREYYKQDIIQLENLFNRDLSKWK